MKIAVTYDNGQIFQHFGHTEQFKLYDVEDGKVTAQTVVDAGDEGHGALAQALKAHGVDTLVCGGIGGGAQQALAQAGIRIYGGVKGEADAAVEALLSGELAFDPNARCDHHDHAHGEGHCGHGHHGEKHGLPPWALQRQLKQFLLRRALRLECAPLFCVKRIHLRRAYRSQAAHKVEGPKRRGRGHGESMETSGRGALALRVLAGAGDWPPRRPAGRAAN